MCLLWGTNQPSLCTQWKVNDPRFLHVDSKDSDQTGRMSMSFCWFCHAAAQVLSFFKSIFTIELNPSCGAFSLIEIKLNMGGKCALNQYFSWHNKTAKVILIKYNFVHITWLVNVFRESIMQKCIRVVEKVTVCSELRWIEQINGTMLIMYW